MMQDSRFRFGEKVTIDTGDRAGQDAWIASYPQGQSLGPGSVYSYWVTLQDPCSEDEKTYLEYQEWELKPRG